MQEYINEFYTKLKDEDIPTLGEPLYNLYELALNRENDDPITPFSTIGEERQKAYAFATISMLEAYKQQMLKMANVQDIQLNEEEKEL